jgi:hypothetical protein
MIEKSLPESESGVRGETFSAIFLLVIKVIHTSFLNLKRFRSSI